MGYTTYRGIDYSLGQSNVDRRTGIHFGVISQNAVNMDVLSDCQESEYGDPSCPKCGGVVIDPSDESIEDADWNDGKDWACTACQKCFWSDRCYPDEPIGHTYNEPGYKLDDCLDNDLFVLESPYFTYAQYCSPCVPGAGNLESPLTVEKGPYFQRRLKRAGFPRVYCLGPEWFDQYNPIPYRCWRVSDGTEVK